MAGHSKWHNIRHKKAAQDAKKAKIYTKISKLIELAARQGWGDPNLNPALEAALEKARYYSVPKDVIERAIKKWTGQLEWEQLEEIYYEWYAPWWVALYIKCITSNKNRTGANVRSILTKNGGSLWEPGSVSWQFKEKWVIYLSGKIEKVVEKWKEIEKISPINIEELEERLLELDIEDFEYDRENNIVKIITPKESFANVKKILETENYKIEDANIEFVAENLIEVDPQTAEKVIKLIEALEEDDDVDTVYHNMK